MEAILRKWFSRSAVVALAALLAHAGSALAADETTPKPSAPTKVDADKPKAEPDKPKFSLDEPADDRRVLAVSSRLSVDGKLETALGGGKSQTLPLVVEATHVYSERRLAGAGRGPEALRSLRAYERAEATIEVNDQTSSSRLGPERPLIVAHGRREGLELYCLGERLRYSELELLRTAGDPLIALGMLPRMEVTVGQTWTAESWVIQTLTGTEAVLKSDLACTLESVAGDVAKVGFKGKLEGATLGATAELSLTGHYLYDMKSHYLSHLELTQTEKRSVGAVSPGLDVTAKVVVDQKPAPSTGRLTDDATRAVPLEPDPQDLALALELPWKVRLVHGRNWHVYHQRERVAVLRLMDRGSLIAQCNVTPVAPAAPGKHTPEKEFLDDVGTALGERLKKIEAAEEVKSQSGRYIFRVVARGEANGLPVHWIYYLCADPSGRQVSLVFAVETSLREKLEGDGLPVVERLEFLP
ncbi:MAG: hypothetical protein KY476_15550 [Planctomycetes bacterium]|nr:hypothetical protein [Planctomycetota bacterium]